MIGDLLALEAHRRRMDTETLEMLGIGQLPHPAAGRQQRLGGHAAAVDAGAAHVARFDDRHLEAVVGGVLGRIKTAVAGADDDHIEIEGTRGCRHRGLLRLLKGILSPQVAVAKAPPSWRWRQRSSSSGAAATATFRDSTAVLWGMVTQ